MIKSGFGEKAGREDECGVCRIHRKSLLITFSEGTGHRSDAGCKSMYVHHSTPTAVEASRQKLLVRSPRTASSQLMKPMFCYLTFFFF